MSRPRSQIYVGTGLSVIFYDEDEPEGATGPDILLSAMISREWILGDRLGLSGEIGLGLLWHTDTTYEPFVIRDGYIQFAENPSTSTRAMDFLPVALGVGLHYHFR